MALTNDQLQTFYNALNERGQFLDREHADNGTERFATFPSFNDSLMPFLFKNLRIQSLHDLVDLGVLYFKVPDHANWLPKHYSEIAEVAEEVQDYSRTEQGRFFRVTAAPTRGHAVRWDSWGCFEVNMTALERLVSKPAGYKITSVTTNHGATLAAGGYVASLIADNDLIEIANMPGPYTLDITPVPGSGAIEGNVTLTFKSPDGQQCVVELPNSDWYGRIAKRVELTDDYETRIKAGESTISADKDKNAHHNDNARDLTALMAQHGITFSGDVREKAIGGPVFEIARDIFGAATDVMTPFVKTRAGLEATRSEEQQR